MPSELSLEIAPEDLAQIVQSAFENMLGLEVSWCGAAWTASSNRLTALVHITGESSGTVVLECSPAVACQFAGKFLSIDPPAVVDEMVRDVLGELANIIGGNVKSALAQGLHLSIPAVLEGSLPVAMAGERLEFVCANGPLWVAVTESR